MGKFKIGDRVRYTGNHDGFMSSEHLGKVGTVFELLGGNLPSVNFDDGTKQIGCFEDNVEALSQLKIGDRVRYRDEFVAGEGLIYSRNEGDDEKYYDWVVRVAEKDLGMAYFIGNTCRKFKTADLSLIGLKFKSGKFYKTRDGRKVGPAFVTGSTTTFGEKENWSSAVWTDTGRQSTRDDTTTELANDIIAEWVDEPAVAVAASNSNATKPKFKVGDRVRCVDAGGCSFLTHGSEYVVDSFDGAYVNARWDNGRTGGMDKSRFVNVPTPTNPAIVALIENGVPKPSAKPFVHADEASASKEAARLANSNKGQSFGVYVLTQTVKEEVVYTYKHEWQRLAANGDKIPAIKALRDITGLGLKATKDAVEHWIANDQQYSRIAA